ncbi:MAG: hypothetical protein IT341_10490 [Chloroflexi bacterium]|nr:hypothetical protein [Chloroflexota bacterium]
MTAPVRLDSLVRGPVGSTEHVETMRVFAVDVHGNVSGINGDGRQRQMREGVEVVEGPRPVAQRGDVPERLRA